MLMEAVRGERPLALSPFFKRGLAACFRREERSRLDSPRELA